MFVGEMLAVILSESAEFSTMREQCRPDYQMNDRLPEYCLHEKGSIVQYGAASYELQPCVLCYCKPYVLLRFNCSLLHNTTHMVIVLDTQISYPHTLGVLARLFAIILFNENICQCCRSSDPIRGQQPCFEYSDDLSQRNIYCMATGLYCAVSSLDLIATICLSVTFHACHQSTGVARMLAILPKRVIEAIERASCM